MRAGLFWLNEKQWACIAPHLPTNLSGPERDDDRRINQWYHPYAPVRRPLARLPARVWSLHDHLQSLQSLGQTRTGERSSRAYSVLRSAIPSADGPGSVPGGAVDWRRTSSRCSNLLSNSSKVMTITDLKPLRNSSNDFSCALPSGVRPA
jgi:hypothetical protein